MNLKQTWITRCKRGRVLNFYSIQVERSYACMLICRHKIPLNVKRNILTLVGTRDGRTQSARACKPAVATFGSQDLGFRISINRHLVSLSGPGFQDLDKQALGFTLRTWVSGPRKLSILRSSYFFPITFLCVQWSQTHARTQQVTLYI